MHTDGSSALAYAPQHQTIISTGKKGDVCVLDVRQRAPRHTFHAHDATVKCLALDPMEQFFVTGSADGDIKVRAGGREGAWGRWVCAWEQVGACGGGVCVWRRWVRMLWVCAWGRWE